MMARVIRSIGLTSVKDTLRRIGCGKGRVKVLWNRVILGEGCRQGG